MSSYANPPSLQTPPISALVPVGQCQFGPDAVAVPLLERQQVSPTTSVLKFGLPDTSKPLQLSTCACILATTTIDGNEVTRPYTPISTNQQVGSFDLLVKDYGPEHGTMSHHLCTRMAVGESVMFKHIPFNVKTQAPFPYQHIGMLVGGTGVTPFVQALHAILGSGEKTPKVSMLYGSRNSQDILGHALLKQWAKDYPDQFELIDVLSEEPEDSDWTGERGYINQEMIAKYFPKPSSKDPFQIWICGPPPMYNALSGPRQDKELSGLLKEMGYDAEQVYKF